MSRTLPIMIGTTLGIIHFVLVGIPFVQSGGGGEAIGYRLLFVDFPLFLLAEAAFPRLLLNRVLFNFFWFVILGSVMYCVIGYGVGSLFNRVRDRKRNEAK